MEDLDKSQWLALWDGIRDLSEWFPDGMVMIGGIAVWLHAKTVIEEKYIDLSHDADFYLSLSDYSDLRELEVVTQNRRLGKCQVIKNNIDFDVYVENQTDLVVPYAHAVAQSVVLDGTRCACLGHLLTLKFKAWQDRKQSSKGEKDRRDLARILITQGHYGEINPSSLDFLPATAVPQIRQIAETPAIFKQMAIGNAFVAKQLQEKAIYGMECIEKAAAMGEDAQQDDRERGPAPS
jgi:hypothetical protein